jgi:glyceraldehyde 3-phosphate dehydrogenase
MVMKDAAAHAMSSIMAYNQEPLVSIDFNHNSKSCVFDATQSQVIGNGKMCKVSAWYDNEWAFENRILDILNIL